MLLVDEGLPGEEFEAERAELALDHRVVPGVAGPAHAPPDPEGLELPTVLLVAVDAAAVGMQQDAFQRAAGSGRGRALAG